MFHVKHFHFIINQACIVAFSAIGGKPIPKHRLEHKETCFYRHFRHYEYYLYANIGSDRILQRL